MAACTSAEPSGRADPEAELDALVRAAEIAAVARLHKLVDSPDDAIAARAAAALLRYAGERRRVAARVAATRTKSKARAEFAEVDRLARTLLRPRTESAAAPPVAPEG